MAGRRPLCLLTPAPRHDRANAQAEVNNPWPTPRVHAAKEGVTPPLHRDKLSRKAKGLSSDRKESDTSYNKVAAIVYWYKSRLVV